MNEKILNERNRSYTILYCVNICDSILLCGSGMYLGSGSATLEIAYRTNLFFGKYATELHDLETVCYMQ